MDDYTQYYEELDSLWRKAEARYKNTKTKGPVPSPNKFMMSHDLAEAHPEIDNPGRIVLKWIDSENERLQTAEQDKAKHLFAPVHKELQKLAKKAFDGTTYAHRSTFDGIMLAQHDHLSGNQLDDLFVQFRNIYLKKK